MHLAVRGEIGSTACQTEAFDPQDLIGDLQANGTNALYLHVLDLYAERLEFGRRFQIARRTQRAANVQRSLQGRVSRDFSGEVSAKQPIGIEMMEGQVQIGRKVVVIECNGPLNSEVRFIEVGVGVEIELASMGDRVEVEISGTLLVEGEILEMKVRL